MNVGYLKAKYPSRQEEMKQSDDKETEWQRMFAPIILLTERIGDKEGKRSDRDTASRRTLTLARAGGQC